MVRALVSSPASTLLLALLVALLPARMAVAADPTLDLTADRITINPGMSIVLGWTATEVDGCTATGGWSGTRPVAGMETVSPTATTTYALACTGTMGGIERAVTITVKGEECELLDESCTIGSATESCRITLRVTQDQDVVRVTVNERTASFNTRWELLRDGLPASSCGSLPPKRTDCGPLAPGDYTILVTPVSGTGMVAVHAQHLVGCASTRIDCEQTVTDTIDPREDSDLFGFTAVDQEVVRVTIRPTAGVLIPEWRLVTPTGTPEPTCGAFRRTGGADCGPLPAGDYRLQVKDEQESGTGTFGLNLQRLTAARACDSTAIRCSQPLTSPIDAPLESDLFRFTVTDAEVVRVAVAKRDGSVVPEWRLLTGAGVAAPECNVFSTLPASSCGPLPAGEYQVQVKDDIATRTGRYEVSVGYLVGACCGDRTVTAPERCDPPGGCCSETCGPAERGTACRPTGGDCDVPETCNGTSTTCPADGFQPRDVVCRVTMGQCDQEETCTGIGASCPADVFRVGGECRAKGGDCDLAESCSGGSRDCPPDGKSTAVCHASTGPCDPAERCDGASDACPPDTLAAAGAVCRPAVNACDVAEVCSGSTADCPPNLTPRGVCGDGCANADEECGEPGLGPCGRGRTCTADCSCDVCGEPQVRCGPPIARDGAFDADVEVYWEGDIATYGFTLAWDAAALRLDAVDAGTTPGFASPPACVVDAVAGTATCLGGTTAHGRPGPDGETSLAQARFARLATGPAAVRLAVRELVRPDGLRRGGCPTVATCSALTCGVASDCDDGDACTDEACTAGACTSVRRVGFALADCELATLLAPDVCGASPVGTKLAQHLERRVTKARALLGRAAEATDAKRRVRVIKRAGRQLAMAARRAGRDRGLTPECSATLAQLLEERRGIVAGLGV